MQALNSAARSSASGPSRVWATAAARSYITWSRMAAVAAGWVRQLRISAIAATRSSASSNLLKRSSSAAEATVSVVALSSRWWSLCHCAAAPNSPSLFR